MKLYKKVLIETLIGNDRNIKVKMNAAAAVIIKHDTNGSKQILLIQRSADDHFPSAWECPRGKCDKGDSNDLVGCIKREVKEETGLDIKVLGLIDTFQYIADNGERLTT